MPDDIEERGPRPEPVRLFEPSPLWARTFAREAAALRAILGNTLVEIQHIGSTAVPGIRAKPVVDIMPIVTDLSRFDAEREKIEACGFSWWGEFGIPGRRFCTREDSVTHLRTTHLHVFERGHAGIERHIAFRDYLRAHPDVAREYEALKIAAAKLHPDSTIAYSAAKAHWIEATEIRAIALSRGITPAP